MQGMQKIGGYLFLLGVLIAIVTAFVAMDAAMVATVLIVLGLIVGLVNVTDKETTSFLVASIALILTGNATAGLVVVAPSLTIVSQVMASIALFVAPAALIVALKAIWNMASSE